MHPDGEVMEHFEREAKARANREVNSNAFEDSKALMRALIVLSNNGENEGEGANTIRDALEVRFFHLDEAQRAEINRMSAEADDDDGSFKTEMLNRPVTNWKARATELEVAIKKFLDADGNDLCHENRRALGRLIGLMDVRTPLLLSRGEFEAGCMGYQDEIYGPGTSPTGKKRADLLVELDRILALIHSQSNAGALTTGDLVDAVRRGREIVSSMRKLDAAPGKEPPAPTCRSVFVPSGEPLHATDRSMDVCVVCQKVRKDHP